MKKRPSILTIIEIASRLIYSAVILIDKLMDKLP